MENIFVTLILLSIIVAIIVYLKRKKAKGEKCIGCPYAKQCNKNCNSKYSK